MAHERLAKISNHLSNAHSRGLLAGEVAIITGAAQGIGRSTALLFAKEGALVVASDLDQSRLSAVIDEIKSQGGEAIAVPGDVCADDFPRRIVDAAIQKYGKLNHIVNNAGFTYDKMLHTTPDDAWDLVIKIHTRAPFRLIRQAAPYLRAKPSLNQSPNRSVINISSTTGLHGNVGQANYATAKAGIIGLTKTIAKEWGPFGVRANTVAFGLIHTRLTGPKDPSNSLRIGETQIFLGIPVRKSQSASSDPKTYAHIPLARGGSPDEAAAAILFLASPLASYVSGHTLEVTGGLGI